MLPLLILTACSGPAAIDVSKPPRGDDTAPDSADTEESGDSAESGGGDDTAGDTAPGEPDCVPGGGPVYVDEGQEVVLTVGCTGGGTAAGLTVVNLPEGATWDAATATVRWTPGLAQAGRYDLDLATTDTPVEHGWATVWVADAWYAEGNVPVDPTAYPEEHGLPVLHLTRPRNTGSSSDVATTMIYRGVPYDIGLKYRGASSLYYPKNSYGLSFSPDHEFEDPATGFPKRRNIVLTSTFDDNSYVRQKMCFDLWNALDEGHQQVETRFVVVYINGAYEGLYLLGDHLDSEWWQDNGYADGDRANIYKAVDHAANFYTTYGGREKSSLHQGYEKKHGDPADWSDLDDLVSFVATSDGGTFERDIGDHLALDEFMDWWILVRFTEADDSGGKNSYLYNDLDAPLFHVTPWDFNHSLGQTWQTDRESVYTDYDFAGTNNVFARFIDNPTLSGAMYDRYRAALAGPYSNAELQALLDAYYAEIDPSARRDWNKWADSYYSYSGWSWRSNWTDYDGEIAYLRQWVRQRVEFMESLYP